MLLVSDFKAKDKNSVFAYLAKIYEQLENVADPTIKEVIWSDGAPSEFKNQFMICILRFLALKFKKPFYWKFFCTSHGKGKCDAIGGKAKLTVRSKMLAQGSHLETVNSAKDFVRIARANLPTITVMEVSEKEIVTLNETHKLWEKSQPLRGILQQHIFVIYPNGELKFGRNAVEFNG